MLNSTALGVTTRDEYNFFRLLYQGNCSVHHRGAYLVSQIESGDEDKKSLSHASVVLSSFKHLEVQFASGLNMIAKDTTKGLYLIISFLTDRGAQPR